MIFIGVMLLLALSPLALGDEGSGGSNPVQVSPTPGFRIEGDRVVGTVVAFTYSPDGPIGDFAYLSTHDGRVEPELLFQTVSIPGYHGVGQPIVIGSDFTADGGVANLTVRDSSTALLQVGAKGPLHVNFTLAPGAEVESGDSTLSQGRCVALDKPLRGAIFSTEGSVVVRGSQVVATLGGPGLVLFRALPAEGQGSPEDEHAVCEAIAERRVGAEVSIDLRDDGPRVEAMRYRSDASIEITKVEKHHLALRIRGMKSEGTRVFLRLNPSVATAADARGLKVTLDNMAVPSGSLTDVLYARGASPQDARYNALVQGPGLGLLTYIPRLSPGGVALTIDVPGLVVIDIPTLEIMGVGVAVVALATLALFRRRR